MTQLPGQGWQMTTAWENTTVVWHPDINDGDGTWTRSRAERRAIRAFHEQNRRRSA